MAEKVNYKALIKFSETSRTAILDVNELFNISTNDIYSTNIIFDENKNLVIKALKIVLNLIFKLKIIKDKKIILKIIQKSEKMVNLIFIKMKMCPKAILQSMQKKHI